MADKKPVPIKTRMVAWGCSAIIGVCVYVIFMKVFDETLAPARTTPVWEGIFTFSAMLIGVVAGAGSFALVFANWFITGKAEAKPSTAPTRPAMQPEEDEKPTEEMPSSQPEAPAEEAALEQPEEPALEQPEPPAEEEPEEPASDQPEASSEDKPE
jgi:type IV secretory pathway VirB10-like protein